MNLIEIYSLEKMSTEKVHCKWFEMNHWKEMIMSESSDPAGNAVIQPFRSCVWRNPRI